MRKTDEEAIRAAADPLEENAFIGRSRSFILRCASKDTHRYVTDRDDEWSVALIAFSEALHLYQADKGPFLPFAALVIRRRLTDHLRSQARSSEEIALTPDQDGELPEALRSGSPDGTGNLLKDEVEAAGDLLKQYGFSFYDLARCSPKAEKTKAACAAAIRFLLESPALLSELRRTGTLPLLPLCQGTGVARKKLERHRRYIIAAAEILSGDFPGLQEYLRFVRCG